MCRSMVDIQSATAEIRRGKKKKKLECGPMTKMMAAGRPAEYRCRPLINAAKFGSKVGNEVAADHFMLDT